VSIIIPVVVAALFGIKIPDAEPLTFLPPIYASINAVTAVLLILAVWAIKNNRRSLHQKLMTSCVILSGMFLLMYVTYHMTSESTSYGGDGVLRPVYFFILISHILLSIAVVPLVLKTYARAYLKQFEKHKKLAKITFPLWLYVAISGVVVYVMISPYYV
jgi:putative membrane protein